MPDNISKSYFLKKSSFKRPEAYGTPDRVIWNYAFYVRKSSDEPESRSIKNQIKRLEQYMRTIAGQDASGAEYVFCGVYQDEDETGTDSHRAGFQRLLRDMGPRLNMIAVTDLSRLSRNTSESLHYVRTLFVAQNVRFVSTQLPAIDSYHDPMSIYSIEVPITSMFNEEHCRQTSFKVRDSFDASRKRGEFISSFVAYGFQKDPNDKHRLIQDPEAVAVIRMMRDWLLSGLNAPGIAQRLNERGIYNPTAYKHSKGLKYSHRGEMDCSPLWRSDTVKNILVRPINVGTLIMGTRKTVSYLVHETVAVPPDEWYVHENAVEPIFTEEEQREIIARLETATRCAPGARKSNGPYLFSGFLRCAECGKAMVRKSYKSGRYIYYICSSYKNFKTCTGHTIRHDTLERAVLISLQKQIAVAVSMEDMLAAMEKAPAVPCQSSALDCAADARQRELDKVRAYKLGLYQDYKDGIITRSEYDSYKEDYRQKEAALQTVLDSLKAQKNPLQTIAESHPLAESFRQYRNIQNLSRELLSGLVEKIIVHEDRSITIKLKYADEYQRLIENLEK